MNRHQAMTGCCLQCDLIRGEVKAKSRVVARTDSLIAYCPFASRLPMLVRITTVDHLDRYESLSLSVIEELSHLVSRITTWMQQLHPGVSYNYILNTRPPGIDGRADAHHWSLEIFPRLTRMAGFEWGSHSMINPILPEIAAAQYRLRAAAENPRQIL
jgi:UDPglucose--hexose-1-phosphate uridylyltransferase